MVGKDVMEEKEYKNWMEEAKADLDAYSAEQEAISRLYEQAKSDAKAMFEAEKQQVEAEAIRQKNQAATDSMRAGRNLKQSLASRGLAFSGENAQTDVDLTLALQNRMGEIDSQAMAQKQQWEHKQAETLTDLEREHTKHRADTALKLSQMKAELAGQEKEQAEDGTSSSAVQKEIIPGLSSGSMAQRAAALLKYMKDVAMENAKKIAVTPSVSSRELAKQLVKAAGGNGAVSGYSQNMALEALLQNLESSYLLNGAYRDELMLNLYSMGYNPGFQSEFTQEVKNLQEQAVKEFDKYYDRYFDVYHYSGYSLNECDQMANEKAQFLQLVFLYRNSYTTEMFESAVRELGFGSKLNSFYDEIAKNPDNYVLGSEAKIISQ